MIDFARQLSRFTHLFNQINQRPVISPFPKTHNLSGADRRDDGSAPKFLTFMKIGDVNFHDRAIEVADAILDRVGIMRERAWIDDHALRVGTVLLEEFYNFAFGVGLIAVDLDRKSCDFLITQPSISSKGFGAVISGSRRPRVRRLGPETRRIVGQVVSM